MKIDIAPSLDRATALAALATELAAGELVLDRPHALVAGVRLDRAAGETYAEFTRRARKAAGTGGFAIFVEPEHLMTDDDDAIANIIAQGDGLAEQILAVELPEVGPYRALTGLVNLARGSGLFTAPDRWLDALRRLPAAEDMAAWARQEARLAENRAARD